MLRTEIIAYKKTHIVTQPCRHRKCCDIRNDIFRLDAFVIHSISLLMSNVIHKEVRFYQIL